MLFRDQLILACGVFASTCSFAGFAAENATSVVGTAVGVDVVNLASTQTSTLLLDVGWDNHYVSEGRNNLDNGGILWGNIAYQRDNVNVYAVVGRADSEHYTEWVFGIEYGVDSIDDVEVTVGYQRLEFYGDERDSDNELFSSIALTHVDWLVPAVSYTYSTEADGYFIEFSLHHQWQIGDALEVSPYIMQAMDYGYATKAHDGRNHFQLGFEANYHLNPDLILAGQFSHTLAQQDIKQESTAEHADLDETFGSIHISWHF